jgi:hypothetical protein
MLRLCAGVTTMKRPVRIFLLFCSFTTGLAACQSLPNPFASTTRQAPIITARPAPTAAPAPIPVSRPPSVLISASKSEDDSRLTALKADNARLKNELSSALRDNAKLKKDLTDAIGDNALLKDLAEKKQR